MTVDFSGRAHWSNYSPADFGWSGKWDPMQHPDLLVPFRFTTSRGETLNFGSMHKLAAPIFREFYRRLDAKHLGVLHGDPDEGCYNPRSVTENGSRSFHTWGIATDTEWNNNPMGVGVHRHGDGALPNDTDEIGRPLGIQWGGTWTNFQDFMHNEIHLSPADCIALADALGNSSIDPLEEVMAMYGSKAEFEQAVRRIVREEGTKGFNVRGLLTWGSKFNTIESFFAGNKSGYVSMGQRALNAAAAKRKAGKR